MFILPGSQRRTGGLKQQDKNKKDVDGKGIRFSTEHGVSSFNKRTLDLPVGDRLSRPDGCKYGGDILH